MKKSLLSAVCAILLASLSFSGSLQANTPEVQNSEVTKPVEAVAEQGRVNINTADAEELQKSLLGIGKVKASAIIDYRTANGPFTSADQLLEVKGIGKATLEKNREKIALQ